jgi:hypothetical protein
MTVNIAFKAPAALVFVTDGLATLMDVNEHGDERFLSNMESVEKLLLLSTRPTAAAPTPSPVLAMFNGVGSLGAGSVANDLRTFERQRPRRRNETVAQYLAVLAERLRGWAERRSSGVMPRPFHLLLAGFDPSEDDHGRPSLQALKWPVEGGEPVLTGILESQAPDGGLADQFGAHYAGLTEAVARFVEGYDPALPEHLGVLLAGMGGGGPPGQLEQLAQEAARLAGGRALTNAEAAALVSRYAYMIVRGTFESPQGTTLSEHFSLQGAINYCVFLAQCAYARENLSPTRAHAPRVGSTLQVAYLCPGEQPVLMAGVRLGIRLQGYEGEPAAFAGAH